MQQFIMRDIVVDYIRSFCDYNVSVISDYHSGYLQCIHVVNGRYDIRLYAHDDCVVTCRQSFYYASPSFLDDIRHIVMSRCEIF